MGVILVDLFGFEGLSMIDLALYGQYAENKFNGMNCGIMDQFAIAMGKENHAIFLDTGNLHYEYAPIQMDGAKIVIAASNKKRKLTDSKYNERRAECEEALADIQKHENIQALGELTEEKFEEVKAFIANPICRKRAKHAVYENQRTIQAVKALKENDLETFGKLMNQSHISLRDDYEVTGKELDTLVEAAWKQDGVIGSRMTGAGFGGCTVSIVKEDKIDSFIQNMGEIYEKEIGYRVPSRTPFVGKNFNVTRAGIHADGLLKNEEIYNVFDTDKFLNRPPLVAISNTSGLAGIAHWINTYFKLPDDKKVDKNSELVNAVKDWVDEQYEEGRVTVLTDDELIAVIDQNCKRLGIDLI